MIERIATFKKTKEITEKYEFFFKKNFGQNFLIDQHVIQKIINSADISKDDLIIEVGPGIGSLTQELAERAGKVIAIEIDTKLIPILKDTLADYSNIDFINEDILKVDINKIIESSGYKTAKIVANLPYYITTPIIMDLLEKKVNIKEIIVMVQKEVAYRMCAMPNTKDYGSLTLAVQYYSEPYIVANVPQNSFVPRPNVDSAVIKLSTKTWKDIEIKDEDKFFKLIKCAFSKRRKTLLNCLFSDEKKYFKYSKLELEEILIKSGINVKARGETLNLYDFARLVSNLN